MKALYVSSFRGCDDNSGFEPDLPLRTLARAMSLHSDGVSILLERGSVFENEFLHIRHSGLSADEPLLISSYGDKSKPIARINANGSGMWYQDYGAELDNKAHGYKGYVSSAILLYDVSFVVVSNIEITNSSNLIGESYSQSDKMDRTGIALIAKNAGTCTNLDIDSVIIHDVDGNVYNKHMANGGVYACALKPDDEDKTGVARFDFVSVKHCTIYNVSRWGVAIGYTYRHKDFATVHLEKENFFKYGNTNITIVDNHVSYTGGDGITAMYAYKPLVANNSAISCAGEMNDRVYKYPGDRMGKVAAAIWGWKCLDAIFEHNYAFDTRLNQDGMAYDADSGDHAVYRNNLSYYNDGGAFMICLEEAVDSEYVGNISFDDLSGSISPSLCPNGLIADNEFYVRPSVPFERSRMSGGTYIESGNEFMQISPSQTILSILDELE